MYLVTKQLFEDSRDFIINCTILESTVSILPNIENVLLTCLHAKLTFDEGIPASVNKIITFNTLITSEGDTISRDDIKIC